MANKNTKAPQSFISTIEKLPDLSGTIAATRTLTLALPMGRSYEKLYFHAKIAGVDATEAQIKTQITNMRIIPNGTAIIDCSSQFVIDRMSFYGDNSGDTQADNGILCWDFTRGYVRSAKSEQVMRLGTKDLRSLTVELTLGAVVTVDTIDVYAERSNNEGSGEIVMVYKMSQSFAGTGEKSISDLRRDSGEKLIAFHILQGALSGSAAGVIDDVELLINNTVFYKTVDSLNDSVLKKSGRAPQTSYYHIDFLRKNVLSSAIPTDVINDMRLKINWSVAPTTFDVYQEVLGSIR